MRDDLNSPIEGIEDAITRQYPECVKEPCNECPWRRAALPGHLGPYTPEEWTEVAHGESPIACHKTIPSGGGWGDRTRQCRGAAMFRANVAKTPKNPTITTGPRDTERVFRKNYEFIDHHSL